MIISLGFRTVLNRKLVGFAVKTRIDFSNNTHCFQPACTCRLDMDMTFCYTCNGGEDCKLVRTGMERQFVSEEISDFLMDNEVAGKIIQIACILDSLFKCSGEMRCA